MKLQCSFSLCYSWKYHTLMFSHLPLSTILRFVAMPYFYFFIDSVPMQVLSVSRIMVAWQPIGISMGVFDMCHRYLKERKQFGVPLAAFQINQEKLVRMLGNIQAMLLVGWRLCKLYESGKMTPGHASLGKAWTTNKARETVSLGRELLGGNGILADFLVAKVGLLAYQLFLIALHHNEASTSWNDNMTNKLAWNCRNSNGMSFDYLVYSPVENACMIVDDGFQCITISFIVF
ncbi:uncharacterized protein LOC110111934 [Dendrobium catenatum]|uniref:Acyl-coenzyme A oxidase 4, peroxisomal n=1 Tax=Dendrobium catenatum TaxID=906689 RepID=A0A2I0VYP9_9ASPA|nr:uncharacterized protein LOC110111934 [Dendrobium catenatum]PKU68509.1 Acyl-coenzyme A oxidase 4, peroxisomal [Dendrobium catenatum]